MIKSHLYRTDRKFYVIIKSRIKFGTKAVYYERINLMSKDTNFLSKYTNLYEMTKSIELGAIPTETTEQNLEKASIVEKDVLRKYDAEKVEAIYDDLYRKVVNDVLGKVNVDKSLKKLVDAYENKSKDVKTYYAVERELTQKLSEALMKDEFYVAINTANYYNKELPKSLNKDEKALVKNVRFGQFDKFRESRKSLFGDAKNSIAWRVAHDNFLFYMSNCNVLAEALLKLDDKELKTALGNYKNELGKKTDEIYAMLEDFTDKDNYRKLFTQDAIDRYNLLIIGYTKDDRTKVQGLNELINL
ncbi:hypothetical protein IKQ26_03750, partial [bacterium]|nr:hypothetical protein [bacterium]